VVPVQKSVPGSCVDKSQRLIRRIPKDSFFANNGVVHARRFLNFSPQLTLDRCVCYETWEDTSYPLVAKWSAVIRTTVVGFLSRSGDVSYELESLASPLRGKVVAARFWEIPQRLTSKEVFTGGLYVAASRLIQEVRNSGIRSCMQSIAPLRIVLQD